jgi:hypothetical protein
MKTTASVFILTFAVLLSLAPPVRAQIYYPWCAQYGGGMGGGGTNCGFSTLAQCQATVSGVGGFCVRNSFYTGNADRPVRRVRKPHRD